MPTKRFQRANSQLQKYITLIIQTKMNDSRISPFICVSEVEVSHDFKYCKVKIAFDTNDEEERTQTIKVLQKSEGYIKHELANLLDMPKVPQLHFELDKGTQASIRVHELLKTIDIPPETVGESDDK